MMMRRPWVLLATFFSGAMPCAARAQVPALDSTQRAAMLATATQMNKPAEFVLQHRTELALTAPQVSTLETLVAALRDSATVRQARGVHRLQANPPGAAMMATMAWSGPVDESALREELCRQSANQVDMLLGLAQDRRAVAAVLTPAQVAQLPQLQTSDLLSAVKRR